MALCLLAVAFVGLLALYAVASVPGKWFPTVASKPYDLSAITLTRGGGARGTDPIKGDAFLITGVDDSGIALLSVNTDFPSSDYPVVAWTGTNFPEHANVRMLWRTSYAPSRVFSTPVAVVAGRLTPVAMSRNPDWVGRIAGLALAVSGPLAEPARVTGLVVKPGGFLGQVRDLFHEWLAFERWSGTSINTITGGADVQELPLPPLLVLSLLIAAGAWLALAWRRPGKAALPLVLGVLFVAAWSVLDLQWTWNLTRQVAETRAQYGDKDWQARHLAADDGPLFEFVQKARAQMPARPARVFVVADAAYFRGRGAYHLYPHNVLFDPFHNSLPAPAWMRPGDYVLVYQRRGVEFDANARRLRFEGAAPIAAEAIVVGPGAALFRIS